MAKTILLLGAEGLAECQQAGVPWVREATDDEVDAFAEKVGKDVFEQAQRDGTGRPYFVVAVTDAAPPAIWDYAQRMERVVRLEVSDVG